MSPAPQRRMRLLLRLAVPLLALTPGAAVGAQTVAGRVVEEDSGRPVAGAIVALLSHAARLSPTLSDPDGRYRVVAPRDGTYRLRVDLIGYERWVSSRLHLRAGETLELDVTLPLRRVHLETLVVRASSECALDLQASTDAGMIWEEIRRALTISELTERQALLVYEWRVTERERWHTGLITNERRWSHHGDAVLPWTVRAPALLARDGWVVPEGDSITFYGPGAETLLSKEFIATHCFAPVRRGGRVGLSFTPLARRSLPDITGTIWLDAKSSELRSVEFTYLNLPRELQSTPPAGGELFFARLPTGQWYVQRWLIRMPLPGRVHLERAAEARVY